MKMTYAQVMSQCSNEGQILPFCLWLKVHSSAKAEALGKGKTSADFVFFGRSLKFWRLGRQPKVSPNT